VTPCGGEREKNTRAREDANKKRLIEPKPSSNTWREREKKERATIRNSRKRLFSLFL